MTAQTATVDKDEIERFSRIAEEWWDANGKFRPLHQMNPVRVGYIRDHACKHFPSPDQQKPLSGLTVLDIGCGGGLLCEPLTRLGAQVTGIDASEKNIAVATLHAKKMGLDITYRCATPEILEATPLFDIVLGLEIVEHVANVPAFLRACAAQVKPGGLLFMSTISRTVKSYALAIAGAEYILRWLPRGTHQWKKFLKPSELCAGLREEGLHITHMSGITFSPLQQAWQLQENDVSVNYILTAQKDHLL